MKRPSFQFYPADWQANSNLRRCSHEEKGIWLDVLCLLHDQEEYGICRWSLKEIAQAIGTTVSKLKGLINKCVLKGADTGEDIEGLIYTPRSGRKDGTPVTLIAAQKGPLWYSSRMVVDEHKRVLRGELGGAPKDSPEQPPKVAPDLSPKGGIGATPKVAPDPSPSRAGASSSSTSTSSPTGIDQNQNHSVLTDDDGDHKKSPAPIPPPELITKRGRKLKGVKLTSFELFWLAFNYKKDRASAADAWYDLELDDDLFDTIIRSAKVCAQLRPGEIAAGKTPIYPQGWLTGRRWEDEIYPPTSRGLVVGNARQGETVDSTFERMTDRSWAEPATAMGG